MLIATWWGFVGGAALLIGALIGWYAKASIKLIGLIMGFGAGVLMSAVAFELTLEAFEKSGYLATIAGLATGSLVFFVGDWIIDHRGGHRRKSPIRQTKSSEGGATALMLGALLDGIPESAAIGSSLLGGGTVSASMVAAVFLSNIPESLSATVGLKAAGRGRGYVFGLWLAVCAASAIAAGLGFALLGPASPATVAFVQCFAAGAIITMLGDTMVPEATEHAGRLVGLMLMAGFATAFVLSHL